MNFRRLEGSLSIQYRILKTQNSMKNL